MESEPHRTLDWRPASFPELHLHARHLAFACILLLDQLRAALHSRHYSRRTEQTFATHIIEDGYDIRTVQELLGHSDGKTTMIYNHVLNRRPSGVRSPMDGL